MLDAYRLWRRGESPAAEAICRRILDESQDHPGALHLLACIARAAGDGDRALELLRRGCARPDAPSFVHEERAQLCQERGLLAEAEEAGRHVVAVEPARARAWHHLAITLVMAGKLAAAREALGQAVALDPGSSEARNNLGTVLQRLGEPDGARAQYEAALALAPDNADMHSNLAAVLATLGRHEAALEEVRRAVALKPGLVAAHVHAAVIEMERGRFAAALEWIDGITPPAPDNVEILLVHADILGRRSNALRGRGARPVPAGGRAPSRGWQRSQYPRCSVSDARARRGSDRCLRARAGSLLPRPGVALANQGALLCQIGRAEAADAVLNRALALDPDCAAVWYARAMMKRYAADDPDLDAMEAILAEQRAPAYNERLYLHYALGGAYLEAGNGERAFAHLAAGARMKRALVIYDGAATEHWLNEIAAAFPAAIFAGDRAGGLASELPVFVVGMPRSGTTLIEQILGSHPRIHAAGERHDLEQAVGRALSSSDPRAFPGAFAPERCADIARAT